MVASPHPRPSYSLTGVTPACTVLVYRNGDPFYLGRKFVVHRRCVRTFEALLAQLNEGVEVPFGVRSLYTPQEGHHVHNLSDLKQGGRYVAAGRERFKKLDYIHIGIKKPQRRKKIEVIKPVVHSTIRVPSRWQLFSNKPRNINVFTNGDMLIPPVKFIIPRFTLKNWNCVLALINEKICLRSGGVHRLYTLDGHAVRDSDGLEDNHYYVAAGKEKFKSLPYWRSSRVSPEVQRYGESPKRPRKKKARSEKHSASQPSCRPSAKSPKSPKPADGKAHSVFYAKESKDVKKAKPERATHLASNKAPSIFKADKPRGEVQGAAEVQEDKNLKVEMPIDQVPAQIVQEEEIVAPTSSPADEVEEDGSPYEDVEKKLMKAEILRQRLEQSNHSKMYYSTDVSIKEKKKEWSFKNMFGLFLKKPAESKDKNGESRQKQEEQKQPAEKHIPEQINEKKGT